MISIGLEHLKMVSIHAQDIHQRIILKLIYF
jgi:hypothetical protein